MVVIIVRVFIPFQMPEQKTKKGTGLGDLGWIYPPPSNSHHQDYCHFLVGNPYKPSFVTVTGPLWRCLCPS